MADMTDYLENELLDHVLNVGAYTAPSTLYAKLHTGDPGEDATSNASTETLRKALAWAAASSGSIATNAAINWDPVTITGTETLNGLSIWDALTAGNALFKSTLTATVPNVSTGDRIDIASGAITVALSTAFTTFAANELLDHIMGIGSYTAPTALYVKLHIGDPGANATANPAGETTRVAAGTWAAAASGASSNNAAISWTSVSTSETYSHISLWDALTGGNPLLKGALTTSKAITAGQDAEFAIGELDVQFQ
jgi:hypothetical protein